jgi:tetratricopeptide (TPR) repeat protein
VVAWGLWRMGNGGSEGGGGGKAAVQQVGVRICVVVVVFQTLVCRQRNSLFAREEDVWGEVLALYPRSVRGRHNLGTLLIRRQPPPDAGDLRRAQELFVGLLSDDATDVYALNNLGALHNDASPAVVAAGLYAPERAHDLLVQARHLQPASPAAHYNLGLLHHQQAFRTRREREGSAVAVQRGGEAEARAPRAELTGAITAEEKRHLTQAEQMYRVTLGLDPRHVLARNNLGLVFFRLSRYDEAEREYLAALEQNPQHSDVKANLALLRKAQSAA